MAMTPAMACRQRKLAEQASAQAAPDTRTQGSAYELMQAQLFEHTRELKNIQSVERKIEAKRGFLSMYWPWVDGVLASGQGAEDMVLTNVFVWSMDVGEFDRAIAMAQYILAHNLKLPDRYQRTAATTLIDEVSDASLRGYGPSVLTLLQVAELTAAHDVPDQARAKLHKAIGFAMAERKSSNDDFANLPLEQAQHALQQLQRATELSQQAGVKKDIERLQRRITAAAAA